MKQCAVLIYTQQPLHVLCLGWPIIVSWLCMYLHVYYQLHYSFNQIITSYDMHSIVWPGTECLYLIVAWPTIRSD